MLGCKDTKSHIVVIESQGGSNKVNLLNTDTHQLQRLPVLKVERRCVMMWL